MPRVRTHRTGAATMACCRGCCGSRSRASLAAFLLLSAVPLALIVALERTKSASECFEYHSLGWVRESAEWDDDGRRFLVSTFFGGGVSEVPLTEGSAPTLEERSVLQDPAVKGNGSVGILLDRRRGRLLVTYVDLLRGRYAALGAYDLGSWRRLFLTQLSAPGDRSCLADDVAVDDDGNAYVTDAKDNKIWKVSADGRLISTIRNPAFTQGLPWYSGLVGLNGIVFHPNGYLLVIHTLGGRLFKLDVATGTVSIVQVTGGSLVMGDGLALFSPTKLVVAGTPSGRLVESSDDWATGAVTARYRGPMHRIASSAVVKDGKVYLNHLVGGGLRRRTHLITEAVFHPVNTQ